MTDRNVQFPNRFEIVPVPGTTNIFDVTPAPGAVYEDGTFWNKQNVLKDATAALYGKSGNAVPDEIFAAIRPLITAAQNAANTVQNDVSKRAYINTGSYEGTSYGATVADKTIYFDVPVKMLFIWATTNHQLWFAYIPKKILFQFGSNSDQSSNIVDVGTNYITLNSKINNKAYGPYHYIAIG